MIRDCINIPTARTWRDIPQPVVPRAMSREGRLRLVLATLRITALLGVAALLGWGVWLVAASLHRNTQEMPAVVKATPLKQPELHTDGVLDDAWLMRTLALPKQASLMELDLAVLRGRLLAHDQVVNATLTAHFPDRLVVRITERGPVARVLTEFLGQRLTLLVARDGVIYSGVGYDPALLETLPWLDGISIKPEGAHFKPIAGMPAVAELLGKARLEAEHLYEGWSVVSLVRLQRDGKIEVRSKDGTYHAFFSTADDYFRQLVKLNYIHDQLVKAPDLKSTIEIDLTLGQDVPVKLMAPAAQPMPSDRPQPGSGGRMTNETLFAGGRAASTLFALPNPQPRKTKREL